MKNLKITVKIFLGALFIAALLGKMDNETASFSQILLTLDGQLFLLLYGVIITIIVWSFIGVFRLENKINKAK